LINEVAASGSVGWTDFAFVAIVSFISFPLRTCLQRVLKLLLRTF
jgi:hypothetical protein